MTTINGVACSSDTQCKAVGDSGTIVSWDGSTWSADASGTTAAFYGVDCSSPSQCKAAGQSGYLYSMLSQTRDLTTAGFDLNITAAACLTGVSVTEVAGVHPHATSANLRVDGRYYTLSPTPSGCTGFQGTLTLTTTITPGANDRLCRYTGTGDDWECAATGFGASTITRANISHFSDWVVASSVGPNAVTLRGLHASAPAARPYAFAALIGAVALTGVIRRRRSRAARTMGQESILPYSRPEPQPVAYAAPEVVYEAPIEAHAGSPLSLPFDGLTG